MNRLTSFLACSLALLACGPAAKPNPTPVTTPVGTPIGSPATATIGAAGGSLASPDSRLKLTVPAGALAADTAISIQPITGKAPGARGNAYRLTPDGQTFQKPVSVAFSYADADLANTAAEALGVAYQSGDGLWHWVGPPAVDATAKTVTVSTDHFTDYAPVAAFGLRPASATVQLNKTLTVAGVYCYLGVIDPAYADQAGIDCGAGLNPNDLEPIVGAITEWNVNGVSGGTPATGTVTGSSLTATYTAPSSQPSGAVTVSARMRSGPSGTAVVSSRLSVGRGFSAYLANVSISGTFSEGPVTRTTVANYSVTMPWKSSNAHGAEYDGAVGPAAVTEAHFTDMTRSCVFSSASGQGSLALLLDYDAQTYHATGGLNGMGAVSCTDRTTGQPTGDTSDNFTLLVGTCDPLPTYFDLAHFGGSCEFIEPGANVGANTIHVSYDFSGQY